MVSSENRWEEDFLGKMVQSFRREYTPKLQSEIGPRQAAIKSKHHKWGLYFMGTIGGGIIATLFLFGVWGPLGWAALIGTIGGSFYTHGIKSEKNQLLYAAQNELDEYVQDHVLGVNIFDPREYAVEVDYIGDFSDAGYFEEFDTIHHLNAYAPHSAPDFSPLMSHTHLTRTEIQHYKDKDGHEQTREIVIQVFNGLLFVLDFPAAKGDHRTLITTKFVRMPSGKFERTALGKPRKMKAIKSSSLEFGRIFKVFCDDQTLGHDIIHPDRVVRLTNLYNELRATPNLRSVSMLLTEGKMWVALDRGSMKDHHGFPADQTKVKDHMETLARQISVPHAVVKHLKLPSIDACEWQSASDI